MDFNIKPATVDDIAEIAKLTNKARAEMFPHLGQEWRAQKAEQDLATFQQTFIDQPERAYLTAHSEGKLVATVGYQHYDYRFSNLDLETEGVVEVVRLYVDPDWRRGGLASKMFAALVQIAKEAGFKQLYLHTHPFLPGAIKFWERQGFALLRVDADDPVWQTTHMSRSLRE
ncbi:acetyltransferase [Colletotrichum tofieldiae]|uniref:Acetyltransferase n=1 Tax=Colletotrichum tofieldiae TaxID=708197 RepID=A0A166YN54_9PEZI|nr:acetyltransferase [Colletotrichum tofieldiae]GKT59641.1 acetyltransferase [Colletotrichum tofieldiae]GKT78440.1 acetyltransferase [Colletotrichum tofieldiae]GKT85803.1 acetyltransferase [Colletotrichum tofieldiae]